MVFEVGCVSHDVTRCSSLCRELSQYLDDIQEIEHWSVDAEKRTPLISKYLEFWKLLPQYYHSLYTSKDH